MKSYCKPSSHLLIEFIIVEVQSLARRLKSNMRSVTNTLWNLVEAVYQHLSKTSEVH